MALKHLVIICITVFVLSGCAHSPRYQPLSTSWAERQQELLILKDWQFRAHAVFKMPDRKMSTNVFWQQQANTYQVMLFGPLGLGAVSLEGQSNNVRLKDSHGHVYEAENPESLMQSQLGWSLPISSLYYWVRGLPAPGAITRVTYDAYHRIAQLEQQGWQINYEVYQRVQALELPQEITFMQKNYYMRLTIEGDSWEVRR